jgi:PAS domain S-box-containing protein
MGTGAIRLDTRYSSLITALKSKLPFLLSWGGETRRTKHLDGDSAFKWTRETSTQIRKTLELLREQEDLHRLFFEKVPHPRFVCDAKTLRILAVNEAAIRCYGHSRDEFLRMKVTDLSAPECRSDFKKECQRLSSPQPVSVTRRSSIFRHRKKDGRLIDVEVDAAPTALRGRRIFLLLTQDVTERRRADQRLRAHEATTRALAESSRLAEASPKIFRAICENLGCDWGELWRVDPAVNALRCAQVWHPESQPLPEMERVTRHAVLARGESIPGLVWARNKPVWLADLSQGATSKQALIMTRYGLQSAYAFPIRLNKEVLGVIAVYSEQVLPPDKHLLRLLKDISSQIGQAMGRRRAERQLLEVSEREQQRIGQDLHDGLCQQLVGMAYIADNVRHKLANKSRPEAVTVARIAKLARTVAIQARQIARGLNPVSLGKTGLMTALDDLVSSTQAMFSIRCRFDCYQRVLVPDHETAVHLYRIAQEAIQNSITHGKATEIVVSLRRQDGAIIVGVTDNGCGLAKVSTSGSGMGFENMNYRARTIGARLEFAPRNKGGTVVNCTLPSPNGRS